MNRHHRQYGQLQIDAPSVNSEVRLRAINVPCARRAGSTGLRDRLKAEERDESRQHWSEIVSIRGVLEVVSDGFTAQL